MKSKFHQKNYLNVVMICMTILFMSSISAQNLVTNGNFQNWGTLTDDTAISGLYKGVPTGWTVGVGNGSLATYQSTVTPASSGYSVFLCNTSASVSRFFSPNTSSLTPGIYKLTFKTKGKVKWGSITLTESTVTLNTSVATTQTSKNRFPTTGLVTDDVPAGTDWHTREYTFSISDAGAYRVIFWPTLTVAALIANQDNFFLVNDVVLEPFVDNTISTLSAITVGGKAINNFNSNTTTYNILTNNATIPAIIGTPTDGNATVLVSDPVQVDNFVTYQIEVTAADGITKKTYSVVFEITNDVLLQGFTSDGLPESWISSQTAATNDWMIDVNANYNNGLYMGSNSVRIRGGLDPAITTGWLMIPNLNMPDVMTFYLKARDAGVSTFSVYKRVHSADAFVDLTGWTLAASYTAPYDAAFTKQTISLNSTDALDVLLYVEKENTKIPFALDDIRITQKDSMTSTRDVLNPKLKIFTSKGYLNFEAQENISYRIRTISGSTIKAGQGNAVSLRLPQGFYLIETDGITYKVIVP